MHLHIFEALVILTYSTSLYLLTAVSDERCLSVLWPIWYQLHRPTYLSALMYALLWAVCPPDRTNFFLLLSFYI